ncbi:MAG: hypothetical protein N3A38_06210 [Planctomycetota bacterium]|nr:hypothetical protein [Planctomycetota bacterium]
MRRKSLPAGAGSPSFLVAAVAAILAAASSWPAGGGERSEETVGPPADVVLRVEGGGPVQVRAPAESDKALAALRARGGGTGETSGEAGKSGPAATAWAEHPENVRFRLEPIVAARNPHKGNYYAWRYGYAGILDGPGLDADICDAGDISCDAAGNCFWTEPGHFNVLRMWRASDGRVLTIAGSQCGYLDGPLERARFNPWGGGGYNPSQTTVSRDGKHVFIRDVGNNNALRHVDLDAGVVSTVGHRLVFARDLSGDVYVLDPRGGTVPPGKGYKTLQVPKLENEGYWYGNNWKVLDVARGRLYAENRGPVYYWDLKTGKIVWVTSREKGRPWQESGPMETATFWCPIGLSISPGGRFLYVGGGDASTIHRIDLEKKIVQNLGRNPDGTCSFKDGREEGRFCDWPSTADFAADGTGYWGSPPGIFKLTPVK